MRREPPSPLKVMLFTVLVYSYVYLVCIISVKMLVTFASLPDKIITYTLLLFVTHWATNGFVYLAMSIKGYFYEPENAFSEGMKATFLNTIVILLSVIPMLMLHTYAVTSRMLDILNIGTLTFMYGLPATIGIGYNYGTKVK